MSREIEDQKPEPFPLWRWKMWLKGYGSYRDIEKMLKQGDFDSVRHSSSYSDRNTEVS